MQTPAITRGGPVTSPGLGMLLVGELGSFLKSPTFVWSSTPTFVSKSDLVILLVLVSTELSLSTFLNRSEVFAVPGLPKVVGLFNV